VGKTALLNKLRSSIEGFFQYIAGFISRAGVTPNQLTSTSLIVAIVGYLLVVVYKNPLILVATILVSGFIDVVDGALARLKSMATKRGAFLDSIIDRLCEVIYSLSLIEIGFEPRLVLAYTGLSMMVSYGRARGESLGVSMSGVGLMERAERLIGLVVTLVVFIFNNTSAQIALLVLTTLTGITVLERFIHAWRLLGTDS
jgi:archaetidylinositol phosphate synthase